MKKLAAIIAVLILATAGYYIYSRFSARHTKLQAVEYFSQGRKDALAGNDSAALNLLQKAVNAAPDNAEFNYYAGISARNSGKKDAAYNYFLTAWNLGMKEPQVFLNMNATSPLPRLERSKFFAKMVDDLQDNAARLELKAMLLYEQDKLDEAAMLLRQLFTENPQGDYAEFYAQILVKLEKPQEALKILEQAREKNLLNENCYIMLLEIYFALDRMTNAQELFLDARNKGLASAHLIYRYGRALFYYGENTKAGELLNQIKDPRLFTIADITSPAILRAELKKNSPFTELFLSSSSSEFKQLLSSDDDNRFSRSRFIQLAVITANRLCLDNALNTPKYLPQDTAQQPDKTINKDNNKDSVFMRNAQILLKNLPGSFKTPDYSFLSHSSRVILQTIYSIENNPDSLIELLPLAEGSKRWLEGERYYGNYLLDSLSSPGPTADSEKDLRAAASLMPDNKLITINIATSLFTQEKYQEGLVLLDKAERNNLIISRSPVVLQIKAAALSAAGNLTAAKEILLSLLRRGFATESSIYELSNLAFTLNDLKTAGTALEIIKQASKKSPQLYYLAASILLQNKEYQQALDSLKNLENSQAEDSLKESGILLQAEIEFQQNQTDQALKTLNTCKQPTAESKILRARILQKLSRNQEAIEVLQSINDMPENAREIYASVLAAAGKIQEAKAQLNMLITANPDNYPAHLNLGIILSGEGDFPQAIHQIETVIKKQPDNIRANLLLAQLSLQEKKTTEAITLGQKVLTLAPDNLPALQLLPAAYNEAGWYDRAIISADYALAKYPDNPFILTQKAVALVNISEKTSKSEQRINKPRDADSSLADEVASLTEDIVFTGAMKDFSSTQAYGLSENSDTASQEKSRKELLREAITTLQPIAGQPAAKVFILSVKLKLGETAQVQHSIAEGKMSVNELFSLGVITDREKDWHISKAAYFQALLKEPDNPIILNNYAWAALKAESSLDKVQREFLLKAAEKIPVMLKGDIKALNTATEVYDYLKMPESIIRLAVAYPDKFKYSPKLEKLLVKAQNDLKKKQ